MKLPVLVQQPVIVASYGALWDNIASGTNLVEQILAINFFIKLIANSEGAP